MLDTLAQYEAISGQCRDVFVKKTKDYGTSWRVYRIISITDQIYIKAWRIRQIQQGGEQKIADSIESEFAAIVNYGIMGLVQLALPDYDGQLLDLEAACQAYDTEARKVKELMLQKNHDYGEAWRNMNQESFADLILAKLLRIRQILGNDGKTLISEGIDANFADIVNYAVFALIKMQWAN
ncbi:MAG: DUF1599 domain-containing protein [Edaphocola sp.]